MKSIEQLIEEQSNIMEQTEAQQIENQTLEDQSIETQSIEAQQVEGYSSDQVMSLIKESVNIHWQQAMELTGQGAHLKRWGYTKLGDLFTEYGKEEHEHAAIAIHRLEFFDQDYQPITVTPRVWKRHDVKAMIEFNLQGVKNAAIVEKSVIKMSRELSDEMTAQTFIPLVKGSDDGIEEFERMLKLIEQMGIENFLTLQA
jgi:bacterioferritin (cytochrome b1)